MASTSENDTVTDGDITTVTDELGPAEFYHLFGNLSIPTHKVEIAEASSNTADVVLKARAVLRWWRKTQGSGATHKALFDARDKVLKKRIGKSVGGSEEFNLQECQDQLRELYLGPKLKVQLTPQDPDHTEFMDAIFVNLELKKDEKSSSETKDKQTPLQKNEDLVTFQTPTGVRVNRILIQGEAGSGKSTLLNNLAYKWALQLDPAQSRTSSLSEFDLVFIIRINEINNINDSVEKIIFDQILEDGQSVSQTSLKSYLQSNAQKKCLFLIDGLNEDSVGILNSTTADMSKVLYNKMYKRSCAIASIRPYKLQAMGDNQRIFTKVKLTGFSGENIEEYIKKYFSGKAVDYSSLLQRLKEEPHVWDLARTPLLLMFFCVLWDDPIQAKRSLPNTRTKLYQETITSLWRRYQHKKLGTLEEAVATDDTLQIELINFLEALGQVTLEGLLNNPMEEKVLFKESDFEALFENTEKTCLMLALKVGILTRERFRSKLHIKTSVKFFHTSIQDFCSAVYLANLQDNEKCKDYAENLLKPTWITSLNSYFEVLLFCVGYKPETLELITEGIVAKYRTLFDDISEGEDDLICADSYNTFVNTFVKSYLPFMEPLEDNSKLLENNHHLLNKTFTINMMFITELLFALVFEAQLTYEECNELAIILLSASIPLFLTWSFEIEKYIQYQLNLLKPVNDTNTGLLLSSLYLISSIGTIDSPQFYSLVVSMLKYSKQLYQFTLKFKCAIEPSQVSQLSEIFDELAHLQHLRELALIRDANDVSTYGDVDISNSLPKICHLQLHQLHLVHVMFTAKSMTEFLCSNHSLILLAIITPSDHVMTDMFSMMTAVSNIQPLRQLTLYGIAIGRAVKCLKSIIPQLTTLVLCSLFDDVWDVHELVSYLGKAKKLTRLVFSEMFLDTAVNNLADQLKHMVNLKDSNLKNTGLGNHGCQILAEGIKTMSSLWCLNLCDNSEMGLEGRQAIENLRTLPQFHELEITFDIISYESIESQILLDMQKITNIESHFVSKTFKNLLPSPYPQSIQNQPTQQLRGQEKTQEAQTSALQDWSTNSLQRIRQELTSSGQEGVQDSFLPDCRNCMYQIYNSITKPIKVCHNPTCMRPETEVPGGLKGILKCGDVQFCNIQCLRDHWKVYRSVCGKQF